MSWVLVLIFGGVLLAGLIAAGLSYLIKARIVFNAAEGHNDITGFVFATVSVMYSVLLAFIVVAVWERFVDAERVVDREAATMIAAYRDTQAFPEPQRTAAQQAFRDYARTVIAREWSTHSQLEAGGGSDLLNPVHAQYDAVKPADDLAVQRLTHAEDHLNDLEVARHERHLMLEQELPAVFWLVLGIGAAVTVGFLFFFQFNSRTVHALLTGLLVSTVVAVLTLIVMLENPFAGAFQVDKYPFENALLQLDAIDRTGP